MAAIRVQVAAAEGGGSYAEDGVGWLLDGGHGTVFHGDLRDSVEQEGVGRRGGMEGWDGGVGWRGWSGYLVVALQHDGAHSLGEGHDGG